VGPCVLLNRARRPPLCALLAQLKKRTTPEAGFTLCMSGDRSHLFFHTDNLVEQAFENPSELLAVHCRKKGAYRRTALDSCFAVLHRRFLATRHQCMATQRSPPKQSFSSARVASRKQLVREHAAKSRLSRADQDSAMDFIVDGLATGRMARILSVVNANTRKCWPWRRTPARVRAARDTNARTTNGRACATGVAVPRYLLLTRHAEPRSKRARPRPVMNG